MLGIWLLLPEHLQLGTWDMLLSFTKSSPDSLDPRLALQLIHEAALCLTGIRKSRSLSQKGFELANGLPFIASDQAVHNLLDSHSVSDSQRLQLQLGKLRLASGHYVVNCLVLDPHRIQSSSKRQTVRRRTKPDQPPVKTVQCFFCLDADSHQPLAFTLSSSAVTVTQASLQLLDIVTAIIGHRDSRPLLLADSEHFSAELFKHVLQNHNLHLLTPMPSRASHLRRFQSLSEELFQHHWAGLYTAALPFSFAKKQQDIQPLFQIIQRSHEHPAQYQHKAFLSTSDEHSLQNLTLQYPKRWHIEEFFNFNQQLGWNRAGTLNLNIRYGQMTMALLAQTVIHQLRQRLGPPYSSWDAKHFAKDIFLGLDGDIRVKDDTIVVTYYNAPNSDLLASHYSNLPTKLANSNINPRVPWLYDFKLDFRFK